MTVKIHVCSPSEVSTPNKHFPSASDSKGLVFASTNADPAISLLAYYHLYLPITLLTMNVLKNDITRRLRCLCLTLLLASFLSVAATENLVSGEYASEQAVLSNSHNEKTDNGLIRGAVDTEDVDEADESSNAETKHQEHDYDPSKGILVSFSVMHQDGEVVHESERFLRGNLIPRNDYPSDEEEIQEVQEEIREHEKVQPQEKPEDEDDSTDGGEVNPKAVRMLRLINEDRAELAKAQPLTFALDIQREAQRWAEFMAVNDHYEHRKPIGQNIPRNWKEIGENLAWHHNIPGAHRSLMRSPTHRANILWPPFEQIGIGIYQLDGYYWICQIFKDPQGN